MGYFDNSRNSKTDEEFLRQIVVANTNTQNNTMSQAVSFEGENPDEKVYLTLLSYYNTELPKDYGDYERDWGYMIGRQSTYNNLKMLVQSESIDPHRSFIVGAEREFNTMTNKDSIVFNESRPITVFRFLLTMVETGKVLDDGDFDITEYNHSNTSGDLTIFEV